MTPIRGSKSNSPSLPSRSEKELQDTSVLHLRTHEFCTFLFARTQPKIALPPPNKPEGSWFDSKPRVSLSLSTLLIDRGCMLNKDDK